jgi:archaeosine synthase beta-subunit
MHTIAAYPAGHMARDRFVLERRPARPVRDPWHHQGVCVEDERSADGRVLRAATVFLTGRECPWRCVMCDLWQYTTEADTPAGAIAAQVRQALEGIAATEGRREAGQDASGRDASPRRPTEPSPGRPNHRGDITDRSESGPYPRGPYRAAVDVVKLYNAGSFFDPRAVADADYEPLASLLRGVERVVVESHPSLVGDRLLRFRDACVFAAGATAPPALEVAMGLETAHPEALGRLHKRITVDDFAAAASRLQRARVDLRVFLLVGVPFVSRQDQHDWVLRSVRTAFDCGASVVSLIPTRSGNGAMDALESAGQFVRPTLADLEEAFDAALPLSRGRVFADLWNIERLASCRTCLPSRVARLKAMNLAQGVLARVECPSCTGGRGAA